MFLPIGIRFHQLEWPKATIALIICNVLMFVAQHFMAPSLQYQLMLRPDELDPVTWGTSMFMHANMMHLGVNMVFLWTFGTYLELRLAWGRLLILYFVSGLVAALTYITVHRGDVTSVIGASGAIAGLMGLCVAAAPLGRLTILPIHPGFLVVSALKERRLTIVVPLVAWIVLWVFSQVMLASVGVPGIAFAAHFGGIGAGLLIGLVMRSRVVPEMAFTGPATEEDIRTEKRERFVTTVAAAWARKNAKHQTPVDYMSPRPPNFDKEDSVKAPPLTSSQMFPDEPLDG